MKNNDFDYAIDKNGDLIWTAYKTTHKGIVVGVTCPWMFNTEFRQWKSKAELKRQKKMNHNLSLVQY